MLECLRGHWATYGASGTLKEILGILKGMLGTLRECANP